jgi:hypothetical protein
MSETQQQPSPDVCAAASQPMDAPSTPWTFPAQHRHPAVVWVIVLLIVLQLISAGLFAVQTWKLMDLGERIEQIERMARPLSN